MASPGSVAPAAPAATGAGRGVLYIAFAKFYFLIVGMVIQFRLPVILSEAAWGAFSLVNGIASWFSTHPVAVTHGSVFLPAAAKSPRCVAGRANENP